MSRRRNEPDDPFEDYHDFTGIVQLGHVTFSDHPYELSDDHVDQLVAERLDKQERKIRPGFWLPGETA